MTEYTKRVIVIVPKGQAIAANARAKQVDKVGGGFTWTSELSPTGNAPATHYWCNWQMKPSEFNDLYQKLDEAIPGRFQWFELDHWDPAISKPTNAAVLVMSNPPLKQIMRVPISPIEIAG